MNCTPTARMNQKPARNDFSGNLEIPDKSACRCGEIFRRQTMCIDILQLSFNFVPMIRVLLPAICWLPLTLIAQPVYFPQPVLDDPGAHVDFWESAWEIEEVPVYTKDPSVRSVLLPNGYASPVLQPSRQWPPRLKNYRVTEVNMILTKYPKNKNFWRTNYYSLMAERLKTLFALDARLNDSTITYNLVFQTQCTTEKEAMAMFHGFELVYEETKPAVVVETQLSVYDTLWERNEDSLYWVNANKKIQRQIKRTGMGEEVVLKGLNQAALNMDSTLIAIDCTGSMDPYTNQVLLWITQHFNENFRFFSLFTDTGPKPHKLGASGGIYTGAFVKIEGLMKLFRKAKSLKGLNREPDENDLEAILQGVAEFPHIRSVVLIADNNSCVRDMALLSCIQSPVHIIPCGAVTGINPQYIDLALATGGSIFLAGEGWKKMDASFRDGKPFVVGGNSYRYLVRKKRVVFADKNLRLFNKCDGFYSKRSPCP